MCTTCAAVASSSSTTATDATAIEQRLLETMNHAGLAFMISIGHRVRLFDSMEGLGWVSSEELARQSGLQERYVREWLGAMATGGIVDIDGSGEEDRYRLPDEHAQVLGRGGGSMGSLFQWFAVEGKVEDLVVDAFINGGGVPYEAYERFHEIMAEESSISVVSGLHEHILPLVPGLAEQLEQGIDVLDIGCGSGRAMCELASRYPNSRFAGFDLCEPAIAAATSLAGERKLSNVEFQTFDVTDLPMRDRYELITAFDAIHDQRDPAGVLAAVHRALAPGGTFLMQDLRCHSRQSQNVGHPLCPLLYSISTMHCMTVSLAQGGAGLGTAWGQELAVSMLEAAGFCNVEVKTLPHDIQNNWYVMQKAASTA